MKFKINVTQGMYESQYDEVIKIIENLLYYFKVKQLQQIILKHIVIDFRNVF